ncbi:MAG: hypothetical protein ACI906_003178 [Candidatus Latescibacterota bacterium]|jgi:hypothetical protein
MIPKNAVMRVARPTDHLDAIENMYVEGLGFEILGRFAGHDGFDGIMLGHKNNPYHLEFTHHHGVTVGKAPTADNLLVFYISDMGQWQLAGKRMGEAGFTPASSYNPYWDVVGKTFEDIDGYRVVLQNQEWSE